MAKIKREGGETFLGRKCLGQEIIHLSKREIEQVKAVIRLCESAWELQKQIEDLSDDDGHYSEWHRAELDLREAIDYWD